MSGHVIIDDVAGREPTFVMKGFTKSGNLTELLKAEMYKKTDIVCARQNKLEYCYHYLITTTDNSIGSTISNVGDAQWISTEMASKVRMVGGIV